MQKRTTVFPAAQSIREVWVVGGSRCCLYTAETNSLHHLRSSLLLEKTKPSCFTLRQLIEWSPLLWWSSATSLATSTRYSDQYISSVRCSMNPRPGTHRFRNRSTPYWLHPKSWNTTSTDIVWWSWSSTLWETSFATRMQTGASSNGQIPSRTTIKTFNLCIALCYQSCFVSYYYPILILLVLIDPFGSNHIVVLWSLH